MVLKRKIYFPLNAFRDVIFIVNDEKGYMAVAQGTKIMLL